MQQIKNVWAGLDRRKQFVVVAASVAVFAAVLAMSRMAAAPSLTLLYAGLEQGAAGDVVRALEQRGAIYEVRGGSIYVESRVRDEMRMTLAAEGLPATGGRGYELLDSLNGFGTTSQMFDAAYWRAKEGELARTIVASPHISQARVHLASNGSNPFQRSVQPTASVAITPAGAPITAAQANAVRFLVSSAVTGLAVENVSVIDSNGTVIGAQDKTAAAGAQGDRAQLLRERVLRLVEARVGPGNAVVEVSVDTVTQSEAIRQRQIDPESRVAISTDTEERSDNSKDSRGDVTVASNLPDGDAAGADGSSAQTNETRERVNYEFSETEREITRAPGAVKRLTVAVLVNGLPQLDAENATNFVPRPDEEMAALRDLVASAVGFDETRGDVITLKSMDLPSAEPLGTVAGAGLLDRLAIDVMSLVQMLVLAIVALVLGLFVVRPLLARPAMGPAGTPPILPLADDKATAPEPALTGEIDDGNGLPFGASGEQPSEDGTSVAADGANPVDRLRAMIGERQDETVEILRSWLDEKEESVR